MTEIPEKPQGMKITRTVAAKEVPPAEQFAEAAQRHSVEDVGRAMQGNGQAQPSNIPLSPEDAMVIQIPDGRIVELAQPPIAVAFLSARIMGEAGTKGDVAASFTVTAYVRALMYVRKVNGQPVPRPTNFIEAQEMANHLTDVGMEHVMLAVAQEWPQPDVSQLKIIRKPSTTRNS